MAKKISQLDELSQISGDEELPLVINGTNYKFKLRNVKTLVTKQDVGLDRVDNTSDLDKPVSTATQTALNNKASINHNHALTDITGLSTALNSKSNVGHSHEISNINNLQQALDSKAALVHSHVLSQLPEVQTALNNKANISHNHSKSDITGLVEDLSSIQSSLVVKADVNHNHSALEITNFDERVNQLIVESGVGATEVSVDNLEW